MIQPEGMSDEDWQEQMHTEVLIAHRLCELGMIDDQKDYTAEDIATADAEYKRWLATVKAEAVREFGAAMTKDADPETDKRIFDPWDVEESAMGYADQIEREAKDA